MPAHKTDAQILEEYLPKLKAFTDERLTNENAKRIYDFLKPYHYDKGGWLLYENAKEEIDKHHEFPIDEDSYEILDGYGRLKWLETAKFAQYGYNQLSFTFDKLKTQTFDEESPEYKEYEKTIYPTAVRSIIDRFTDKQQYLIPVFWERLSFIENILEKGFSTRDDLIEKLNVNTKLFSIPLQPMI